MGCLKTILALPFASTGRRHHRRVVRAIVPGLSEMAIQAEDPLAILMNPRQCIRPMFLRRMSMMGSSLMLDSVGMDPQSGLSSRAIDPCRMIDGSSQTCCICLECKVQRPGRIAVRMLVITKIV